MPASLISETMERERERIPLEGAFNLACNLHSMFLNNDSLTNLDCLSSYDGEHRGKKSQNTTECVPVPSSEHVAEIVGRQGCKIKALRAKTNTYIKTPVRGEEPVFVVTGRKEDVCAAKREICSAADHFSQIRAQRKSNSNGTLVPGPNSNIPGQKTIQVRVPYRVVGLVVGPKGATIKRIQQTTNTYIVTPSRDKEPVFDVTGLPDNVECARKEIEAHIAMRTGGSVDDPLEDYSSNGLDALSSVTLNVISQSYFKNDFGSSGLISPYTRENLLDITNTENMFSYNGSMAPRSTKNNLMGGSMFGSYLAFSPGYEADDSTISPTFDGHTTSSSWPDFCTTASSSPEGDGRFNSAGSTLSELSQRSNSLTGGLADLLSGSDPSHPSARRTHSDPMTQEVNTILGHLSLGVTPFGSSAFSAAVSKCTTTGSSRSSPIDVLAPGSRPKRECLGCFESEVVAALIPCGHNNFCMECAQRMCEERTNCPVCDTTPTNAMRIYH